MKIVLLCYLAATVGTIFGWWLGRHMRIDQEWSSTLPWGCGHCDLLWHPSQGTPPIRCTICARKLGIMWPRPGGPLAG